MLKNIIFLSILTIFSIGYTFADDFTTFPGSGFSSSYKSINNHKVVKYKKDTISYSTLNFSKYPFNTISNTGLELDWKTCFYRSSYYWKNTFKNIKNDKFNLSYLDSHKLNKKTIGFEYYGTMIYFVHKDILKENDKEEIGKKYLSSKFNIVQEGNYYMIAIKKNIACRTYYSINELINIDKSISSHKTLTLQVGNNPYDKYEFDENGLNNYFLQLEFIQDGDLRGYIIGLFDLEDLILYPTYYSKDYYKDDEMRSKILGLIDSIESYYKDMWGLPDSINSMFPNWVGYEFIGHTYEVNYEVIDDDCFQVYFKPKSYKFKQVFGFEMNSDWRGYKYCIK